MTDPQSTDAQAAAHAAEDAAFLERFFRERLLPLAQQPGWQASPAGPQPELPSYWISRGDHLVTADDFHLRLGNEAAIATALDAHWQGTPMAGLGSQLAAMTGRFKGREQKDSVSSFVYEMF